MRWSLKTGLIALIAGLFLTFAPAASAQRHRVIIVEPVPVGPFFYGYYPYGYPYGPYGYGYPATGNVKIETHLKDAAVYVDGGYAGRAGKLKKFPLRPGNHNIELRDSDGRTIFQERVAVIVGKTTKIHAG